MRKLTQGVVFLIQEAGQNLVANRWLSLFSVSSIAVSIFLFAFFLYVGKNVQHLFVSWEENVQVRVFLADGVGQFGQEHIESELKKDPRVAELTFVSKEDALKALAEFAPDIYGTASDFEDNPLPASYEVTLTAAAADPAQVEALVEKVQGLEGVEEVLYDRAWLEKLRGYTRAAGLLGMLLGSALLLAALFTISNVIRISQLNRADEIEIMRLVGATNTVIRGPFILEGGLLGVAGGVVALTVLYVVHLVLGHWQESGQAPLLSLIAESYLPLKEQFWLVMFAGAVGLIGGAFSFGRMWKK